MIAQFEPVAQGITTLINKWEEKLLLLPADVISLRRNSQQRTIRQILGHLIDSASNNTHRIVHLQYQESPFTFPNYATHGNNDRWIAIQNYQEEDWTHLVQLWKFINFHLVHVIENMNSDKIGQEWIASANKRITLKTMVIEYLPHLELHLNEIEELIRQNQ